MKLHGHIDEKGNLLIPDRAILKDWLNGNKDKSVELEIKVRRKKRSNLQNAYYWNSIVNTFYQIFRNAGMDLQDEEEAHEILKARFNTEKVVNENTGEVVEVVKSTTRNNTFEQEEYHERCRRWAAEFWGVTIPLPNEQLTIISGDTINGQSVLIAEKVN